MNQHLSIPRSSYPRLLKLNSYNDCYMPWYCSQLMFQIDGDSVKVQVAKHIESMTTSELITTVEQFEQEHTETKFEYAAEENYGDVESKVALIGYRELTKEEREEYDRLIKTNEEREAEVLKRKREKEMVSLDKQIAAAKKLLKQTGHSVIKEK